jgi:aspartyl-tRNA synthetase
MPTPFPRMTYAEAMARFGSDKPDLRFDLELTDCTDYFADTPFRVFQADYVGAVVMPGGGSAAAAGLRRLAGVGQAARRQGLAYVTVGEDGELGGPVAKNISDAERPAWPPTSVPSPATASSSPPAPAKASARCSARPA